MVRSLVLRFFGGVSLACMSLLALPSAVSAQATDLHFKTAITEVYGSEYPLTGRLDLEIFPTGTLRGYYHTSFYKLYIPVAGGRDGNYIWFDIGPSSVDLGLGAGPQGKLHVVATMNNDGSFKGQVYPETAAVLSGLSMQYQFPSPSPATPTQTSDNLTDQYIFLATPTTDVEPTPSP
ncbi:MAG TPA: hypothetical protein VMU38_11005 [Candidatus Binatia bacterium]|nr:hypothetical protein [Candidatus Binatia bacterium]